ncbi:MAG: bifunctional DNA-formamidopyrimidine glycosylase/DNA-(apurinic or apyrimidinic site) lyase [Armatimonadetes bacterium]|nr:bifunctional DNA-formamidopyrimidine glycosylase/DNA-(apurinic or apyrimidinic site) lyase [Armatimonadota bacterium]
MPELPEVETVRRDLRKSVVGRTIQSVEIGRDDILCECEPDDFAGILPGRVITAVERIGKNLILRLSGGPALVVHLGMTGQFYTLARGEPRPDHVHVVLELSGDLMLVYRDTRRFGHLELVADGDVSHCTSLRNVGLDARSRSFTAKRLAGLLAGRTALVKSALLNQKLVAGLGNIYVCEAMHRAGVHPETRCHELSKAQIAALHRAIKDVLDEAIAAEGTTISDYVTGAGVPGGFQRRLRVYGREGKACRRRGCRATIERIVQSNRSTFFCPECQKR